MAVTRKFKPNMPIVRVHFAEGVKHYEVHTDVQAYIRKCTLDGKQAEFIGRSDSKGKLKEIEHV